MKILATDLDRTLLPNGHWEADEQAIDLFNDLVSGGQLEIRIQCDERAQYYGMANADLYLRAGDAMGSDESLAAALAVANVDAHVSVPAVTVTEPMMSCQPEADAEMLVAVASTEPLNTSTATSDAVAAPAVAMMNWMKSV